MRIPYIPDDTTHLYRHIADHMMKQIDSGEWPPGQRLPTVRALAAENNISQGTVKHAYDILEQMGYIEKAQGRGTFVCEQAAHETKSKKQEAMVALEDFLNRMQILGFSPEEIRIFFELKLREREQDGANVQLGAVDCCLEALTAMGSQLSEFPHVDVYEYLLDTVMDADHPFEADLDILVTTPTHFEELEQKTDPDIPLLKLVMAISRKTLLELARIPEGRPVGLLCASRRFAEIITETCYRYEVLVAPPAIGLFDNPASMEAVFQECEQIIIPQNYRQFTTTKQQDFLTKQFRYSPPILFEYRIERGSLVFFEEQVGKLYTAKQRK